MRFFGTFILTFFGCGTTIVTQCSTANYAGYLSTALAFGRSIVAMSYSIGSISGCHINPAVSLSMLLSGKLGIIDFFGYAIAQCAGGLSAGAFPLGLFEKDLGLESNGLYNDSIYLSILIEILLTCIFVISILGVTSREKYESVAGIVSGLSLTFVHILGISLTGTSVNPARSLVAVFAGGDVLKCL